MLMGSSQVQLSAATAWSSASERPSTNSEVRLQGSRRIDWRFLLPDPKLGRVAYVGRSAEDHVRSLRMFSDSLTCVEPFKPHSGVAGQFDVVVIIDPSREMLAGAAGLVKPGGFLYVEVHGLPSLACAQRKGSWRPN